MAKPIQIDASHLNGPYKCGFCSGVFHITDKDDEDPSILHSLPTCKGYDDIETLEDAIRYMRAAQGN